MDGVPSSSVAQVAARALLTVQRQAKIEFGLHSPSLRESLVPQLGKRLLGLAELEAHAREHLRAFRELDLVVRNDLDPVAERVQEVEPATRQDLDARRLERAARRVPVVDDEAEVALAAGRLRIALHQGDELVADLDEGGAGHTPQQLEVEARAVERECLVEIADVERNVVDAD
ncbi:MAG: hypothetical protein ACR2MU_02705, partial [Gaiellaceae bacterium]